MLLGSLGYFCKTSMLRWLLGVVRVLIWTHNKIRFYATVWASPRQEEKSALTQRNRFLMVEYLGTMLAVGKKFCAEGPCLPSIPVLFPSDTDLQNFLSLLCSLCQRIQRAQGGVEIWPSITVSTNG